MYKRRPYQRLFVRFWKNITHSIKIKTLVNTSASKKSRSYQKTAWSHCHFHTNLWNFHTNLRNFHTNLLNFHTNLRNSHTILRNFRANLKFTAADPLQPALNRMVLPFQKRAQVKRLHFTLRHLMSEGNPPGARCGWKYYRSHAGNGGEWCIVSGTLSAAESVWSVNQVFVSLFLHKK